MISSAMLWGHYCRFVYNRSIFCSCLRNRKRWQIIAPMDNDPLAKITELDERVARTEEELAHFRELLGSVATFQVFSEVRFFRFPGGRLPVRQTGGAIGYDAYARAIVDPASKPTPDNPLRRTVADFSRNDGWEDQLDESVRDWIAEDPNDIDKYAVALPPYERLMVGLGFATSMEFPMLYWVAPRSGYAARGITVANAPGTVDPDYRGEAGALIVNNSGEDFLITHNMRIVQVIYMLACIPHMVEVDRHEELGNTVRSAGGFGSTGTH